jgi:GNAT superfamily N-acetyltransferase
MTFKEFIENIEIIAMGDDMDDMGDSDFDKYQVANAAWALAKASPIRILSDKDLAAVGLEGDKVVGALFTGWNQEEFSFDVVVDPKFQQQGYGKKLIDYAMSMFHWDSDGRSRDTPSYIKAEVVNRNLIPLLTRLGFKLKGVYSGITVMIFKP